MESRFFSSNEKKMGAQLILNSIVHTLNDSQVNSLLLPHRSANLFPDSICSCRFDDLPRLRGLFLIDLRFWHISLERGPIKLLKRTDRDASLLFTVKSDRGRVDDCGYLFLITTFYECIMTKNKTPHNEIFKNPVVNLIQFYASAPILKQGRNSLNMLNMLNRLKMTIFTKNP